MMANAFIGGAPRCGTSALFHWLRAHPDVCAAQPKEPFYFLDAGHPFLPRVSYHSHGFAGYVRYFAHWSRATPPRVVCEASTHYLYSETALDVLTHADPVPRVLFVLRRPAQRVYSSFQY